MCEAGDAGIPLGNQSVLLKGVNDCPYIFRDLNQKLLKMRVRPYTSTSATSPGHRALRTSIGKGIEIMEYLRGHTSGLAVPPSWWTRRAAGARSPSCRTMSSPGRTEKRCSGTSRGRHRLHRTRRQQERLRGKCRETCERAKNLYTGGIESLFEGKRFRWNPGNSPGKSGENTGLKAIRTNKRRARNIRALRLFYPPDSVFRFLKGG